jgi:hypothetical protein
MSPILISLVGAGSAIIVSIISALFIKNNSIILESRKLKENNYVKYIESLHNLAYDNNNKEFVNSYAFHRNMMFIIANKTVIINVLNYEANSKDVEKHDKNFTELIKSIRKDLKIKDKDFPLINLLKAS